MTPGMSRGQPCTWILATTRWGCSQGKEFEPDLLFVFLLEMCHVDGDDVPAALSKSQYSPSLLSSVDRECACESRRREPQSQRPLSIDPKRSMRFAHEPTRTCVAVPALAEEWLVARRLAQPHRQSG